MFGYGVNPLAGVDHLINAGIVPKCHIVIYLGHNSLSAPSIPAKIKNDKCSAASVAACFSAAVPVELPILDIQPRPDENTLLSLSAARKLALADFEAAKAHAANVCKGKCCEQIIITINCKGLSGFERWLASDACGKTAVIDCKSAQKSAPSGGAH